LTSTFNRVLVNGSEGIGTGWSSNVPNYNPRQIIANIRRLIAGEAQEKMTPFYDGFVGDIVPEDGKREGSYQVFGKIERLDDTNLFISELPIKKWTQDYKVFLESMMNGDPTKKIEAEIKDFKENHTDATVAFTISCTKDTIDRFEKDPKGLVGKFKLSGSLSTSNMHLFSAEGRICKYSNPEEMLLEFFNIRLHFYEKRKALLLQKLGREQKILSNKARFIEEVCAGDLVVSNRKRADILSDLQERGYDLMEKEDEEKKDLSDEDEEPVEEELSHAELARGYEYLLGMKIWSLTYEKAEELRRQLEEKVAEVQNLEATAPSQLWISDLDEIEIALDERASDMAKAAKEEGKAQAKARKVQAGRNKKAGNRKAKQEWDSEEEDSYSSDVDNSGERKTVFAAAAAKPKVVRKQTVKAPASTRVIAPKQQAATKPAIPPKRLLEKPNAAAPAPTTTGSDQDSDLDIGLSLADRMKQKLLVSPPPKRSNVQAKSSFESDDESIDEFDLDMAEFEPASVTPAKKKAVAKKATKAASKPVSKPATAKSVPVSKPVAKKPVARKPAAKKAPPKKVVLPESEEEDDFLGDTESEREKPEPAPSRTGRARAKVTYKVDFSDDDDSDFD
jgi:DNA topoisomerase II